MVSVWGPNPDGVDQAEDGNPAYSSRSDTQNSVGSFRNRPKRTPI